MSKHEVDDKITFEIHTPETEVPAGKSVLHLDDEVRSLAVRFMVTSSKKLRAA
jgi:hypothetical protein